MTNIPQFSPDTQAPTDCLNGSQSHRIATLWLPPADRYFDQFQVWLQAPLTAKQVNELQRINRHPIPGRGTIKDKRRPMKFQPEFKHRLQIRQPRLDTLYALDEMVGNNPVMINYLELASDHGYSGKWNINHRDEHFDFLCRCWIRKYHRKTQGVRFVHNDETGAITRYDAGRGARNMTGMYTEKFCRNTGEVHGIHLEHRAFTKTACERLGVLSIRDLIQFDHDAFWNERLKHVYEVDVAMLGRLMRNRMYRTRHRKFRWHQYRHGFRFNADARAGMIYASQYSTIQELVDALGFSRVRPALVPVQVRVEVLSEHF